MIGETANFLESVEDLSETMNLFYLDKDFDTNAHYHLDCHITKIQIEAAQILCTALELPHMRPTHHNHPCVLWAAKNPVWVAQYGQALNREYIYRYGKTENYAICKEVFAEVLKNHSNSEIQNFALAMPEEFRGACPIQSYRNYYKGAKTHLFYKKSGNHRWTKREMPEWIL